MEISHLARQFRRRKAFSSLATPLSEAIKLNSILVATKASQMREWDGGKDPDRLSFLLQRTTEYLITYCQLCQPTWCPSTGALFSSSTWSLIFFVYYLFIFVFVLHNRSVYPPHGWLIKGLEGHGLERERERERPAFIHWGGYMSNWVVMLHIHPQMCSLVLSSFCTHALLCRFGEL